MPLVAGGGAVPRIGCQLWPGTGNPASTINRAKWLVSNAVVHIPVWWCDIETDPGVYDWSGLDAIMAALTDYQVILGVKNAPRWLRIYPDVESSEPTEPGKYQYMDLVYDMAERYHPWGVEVWNEPDADPTDPNVIALARYLGAWGNTYDDGYRYGLLVESVCDAVGDITNVLGGALGWPDQSDFMDGLLDASDSADYLSYHCYINDGAPLSRFANMAALMALTDRKLFVTEVALKSLTGGPEFEQHKADLLRYIIYECRNPEICGVLWFTLAGNGWEHTDLVYSEPTLAYYVWTEVLSV